MPLTGLQINAMCRDDLVAVVALERDGGLSSWGITGYERELANQQAILLVAYLHEQFVGYFSGRVMSDEFELFSIAVAPEFRCRGIGGKLLEAGLAALRKRGINRCFLEVRAANLPAQNLYLAHGFKPLGWRRNYYHDPADDAVLMVQSEILLSGLAE